MPANPAKVLLPRMPDVQATALAHKLLESSVAFGPRWTPVDVVAILNHDIVALKSGCANVPSRLPLQLACMSTRQTVNSPVRSMMARIDRVVSRQS